MTRGKEVSVSVSVSKPLLPLLICLKTPFTVTYLSQNPLPDVPKTSYPPIASIAPIAPIAPIYDTPRVSYTVHPKRLIPCLFSLLSKGQRVLICIKTLCINTIYIVCIYGVYTYVDMYKDQFTIFITSLAYSMSV